MVKRPAARSRRGPVRAAICSDVPIPRTPSASRSLRQGTRVRVPVAAPFRLDLTVRLLQRLPAHPVEVLDGGRYVRAFLGPRGPAGWIARTRPEADGLELELFGAVGEVAPWVSLLRRTLGLDVELAPFFRRAAAIPALAPLARAMAGVRPPRFLALHEALASVIPFQQVSLAAGVAALRRIVLALSAPARLDDVEAWPFPSAADLAGAPLAVLRAAGLSGAKARALQGACRAIHDGALDGEALEGMPTVALVARLQEIPGIGPWSAALLALRGFGRLDVFPPGDVAAARLLGRVPRGPELEAQLGPWRGMLYYALFLRRMSSTPARRPDLGVAPPEPGRP